MSSQICHRLRTPSITIGVLCQLTLLALLHGPSSGLAADKTQAKEAGATARQQMVLDRIDAAQLAEYLREEGYAAKLDETKEEKNVVEMKVNGSRAVAFFWDEGTTIEFFMGYGDQTLSLAAINQWSNGNRVSRISIDEDGDAQLSLRLHLDGGVTPNWIVIHAGAFREDCEAFEKVIRDK